MSALSPNNNIKSSKKKKNATKKVVSFRKHMSFADMSDGKPTKNVDMNDIKNFFSHSLIARPSGHASTNLQREKSMNGLRFQLGLYANYPLANAILCGGSKREAALKSAGSKQMNHVRGTDGFLRTIFVLEARAIDKYIYPWLLICFNALLATILSEVVGLDMSAGILVHWNTVYSIAVNTSLAFLLVFRLNRCAMRFWEARGLWGNVTHNTRNLVSEILMYCDEASTNQKDRDMAIRWSSAFCVAAMHFIRSEHEYNPDELAGFLSREQILKLQEASHAPLYAASMVRYYLKRALPISAELPQQIAHAHAIQLKEIEKFVSALIAQVSGMEKIRSTPLPITYVAHLRTFLLTYLLFLPYVWVKEWAWATVPLIGFTAFALLGIEGASSEVEIPFDRSRPNHLALDAYCMIILDSVQGLVVHDANIHTQMAQDEYEEDSDVDIEEAYDTYELNEQDDEEGLIIDM